MKLRQEMINKIEDLLRLYPNQFVRIGELPGVTTLRLKDHEEPYIDPPRKWPIHIREPLAAEMDRLEELGVIRTIQEHKEWCSTMTYTIKPDGSTRSCLDPDRAVINKALKRCSHKTPTIEEIT